MEHSTINERKYAHIKELTDRTKELTDTFVRQNERKDAHIKELTDRIKELTDTFVRQNERKDGRIKELTERKDARIKELTDRLIAERQYVSRMRNQLQRSRCEAGKLRNRLMDASNTCSSCACTFATQ